MDVSTKESLETTFSTSYDAIANSTFIDCTILPLFVSLSLPFAIVFFPHSSTASITVKIVILASHSTQGFASGALTT